MKESSPPKPGKRTRSSTPRARTGCQTCRKRHLKCDETKPSCLRCTRSGWKCDGYESQVTAKAHKAAAVSSQPSSALSITSYSIPFRIPGSQKDRQILHYFCVQGSQDIAGYLSSDFWSKTVLQVSHQEPVVRQALVSLSTLHLDYATAQGEEPVKNETLAQHGKALRALRKRVEESSPDAIKTALFCCILFYCFESTLGNNEAAMHHLESGLNMLSYHRQVCESNDDQDMSALSSVFERLDLQATMFDDMREPSLDLTLQKGRGALISDLLGNVIFTRLEDAYDGLIKLQNWLFHFLTRNVACKEYEEEFIPAGVLKEKLRLTEQFNRWKRKFDNFEHQSGYDTQTGCGTKVLLIHWHVSRMLLDSDYPSKESVFGASPNPEAENVIELACRVLEATDQRNASAEAAKSPRRNFSSETGVVAPLFILAMKCSDGSVSNRASDLLTTSQRREGLYDSQTMAAIVHQFRAARWQKYTESGHEGEGNSKSLERLFTDELDMTAGGMDRRADFVNHLHSILN